MNAVPHSPNHRKRKWLKAIFITIIGFILVLLGTVLYLLTHTDKIKRYVLAELNASLKTEINVAAIDVTFFRTFPFAALNFYQVSALDVPQQTTSKRDTLLKADRLFLTFDIIDLFRGKYQVKHVVVENAGFYMKVFADGTNNYEFWQSDTTTTHGDLFKLSLRKIKLKNVEYLYHNEITRQHYHINIESGTARGDFSAEQQHITLNGDLFLNTLIADRTVFLRNSPLTLSIDFQHHVPTHQIQVKNGTLSLRGLDFKIGGSLNYDKNVIALDLTGEQLKLKNLLRALPTDVLQNMPSFKAEGELEVSAKIRGTFSDQELPYIQANFALKKASLYEKNTKQTLNELFVKGAYSNGKQKSAQTSILDIKDVQFILNQGYFKGNLKIENFAAPTIKAEVAAKLQLAELLPFLPTKEIEQLSGFAKIHANLSGKMSDLKTTQTFDQLAWSGEIEIDNFSLKLQTFPQAIKQSQWRFQLNKNNIDVTLAKGYLGKTTFDLTGKITRVFPFLFQTNQPLHLSGNIALGNVNIDEWFSDKTSDPSSQGIPFPSMINADLATRISTLSFKKMHADHLTFRLELSPQGYKAEDIQMNAFGGTMTGNAHVQSDSSHTTIISGEMQTHKIQGSELFATFDNFWQETLTDKNLHGKISTKVKYRLRILPNGEVDMRSMKVVAHTVIEEGELRQLSLLQKLSRFIDEETLSNVQFQTLTSDLTISEGKIAFEEMQIRSNLANLSFAGVHTMDNAINYRMEIQLSELMSKKKRERMRREQKEFSSFTEDDAHRLKAFLRITGTASHPIFHYDLKSNLEEVKRNLQSDKKTLMQSIDRDFKLDLEENRKQKEAWKKQEKGEYLIEWDEIDSKTDSLSKEQVPETKFSVEWEDE